MDSNKEDCAQSLIEADEAKKIVESITDSITGGEKQERAYYVFIDVFIYKVVRNSPNYQDFINKK